MEVTRIRVEWETGFLEVDYDVFMATYLKQTGRINYGGRTKGLLIKRMCDKILRFAAKNGGWTLVTRVP